MLDSSILNQTQITVIETTQRAEQTIDVSKVRDEVKEEVRDEVKEEVRSEVRRELREEVENEFNQQKIRGVLGSLLDNFIKLNLEETKKLQNTR